MVYAGWNCGVITMYCDWAKNFACAGVGMTGCGKGLVVTEPVPQGLLKITGPEPDDSVLLIAVAKGGFCWLRCAVKKFGLSYINAAPARMTVLPVPAGSKERPTLGENCQGEFLVNSLGIPLSP